jgi:hypothetical protein
MLFYIGAFRALMEVYYFETFKGVNYYSCKMQNDTYMLYKTDGVAFMSPTFFREMIHPDICWETGYLDLLRGFPQSLQAKVEVAARLLHDHFFTIFPNSPVTNHLIIRRNTV